VWVLGRTRVRLRVRKSSSLPTPTHHPRVSTVSLDPQSKSNALLLTTNTEVSIQPKLHPKPDTVVTASSKIPRSKPPSQILRVLPSRFLIAPTIHTSPQPLAHISRSILALLTKTPLHPSDPTLPTTTYYKCTLRRLLPPASPSPPSSKNPPAPPTPHVFHPSDGDDRPTSANTKGSSSANSEVYVAWRPEVPVPEGHIVLEAGFSGVDGIEEWDLIQ
jgi:peroxin-1